MMRNHCYDCGRTDFELHSDDGGRELLSCRYCWELVFADERIGPVHALLRRVAYPWHSNTQDESARGWRRRRHRKAPWT